MNPDALFKIVIKDSEEPDTPDVLAFIYPQVGPGYTAKEYFHENYLTSVDEIEALTGLEFLTDLPEEIEDSIEESVAESLWEVEEEDFIEACQGE